MPQEGGSAHQVTVTSLVLALLHLEHIHVNGFLVNVTAALIVVNEGESGRKSDFAPVLYPVEFTDGLSDATFIKDAKGLPESKHSILPLVEFLQSQI